MFISFQHDEIIINPARKRYISHLVRKTCMNFQYRCRKLDARRKLNLGQLSCDFIQPKVAWPHQIVAALQLQQSWTNTNDHHQHCQLMEWDLVFLFIIYLYTQWHSPARHCSCVTRPEMKNEYNQILQDASSIELTCIQRLKSHYLFIIIMLIATDHWHEITLFSCTLNERNGECGIKVCSELVSSGWLGNLVANSVSRSKSQSNHNDSFSDRMI